jgi:DNA-binding YbaB/EbfC family protein
MNLQQMMKQAQQMQEQFQEAQEEMESKTFEAQSGGGAVTVTISGGREVQEISIEEDVVDPDDVEMLEDLILTALQNAHDKVEEVREEEMGDMGMPMDQLGGLGDMLG